MGTVDRGMFCWGDNNTLSAEGGNIMSIIESPSAQTNGGMDSASSLASHVIGLILDGKKPNAYILPQQLDQYGDCYEEMLTAYQSGGREAARLVFVAWAEVDPDIAALRAGDPAIQKRSWLVADLYSTEFPEPRYTIPGLLPTGLAALGARPKIGKSWMGLQISTAVGTGGKVFDQQVDKGKVLYLALEDSPRRMKSRLQKQGAPVDTDIRFEFGWKPLIGEGTSDLIAEIDRGGYSLVVIDTLARALGFIDPNKQAEMSMHLGVLQRVAVDRNITIFLIDHHRKSHGGDGDAVDDLLGATAKAGVLDVAMGLYRERGERNASLKVTGRDIEERNLAVQFDHETGCWKLVGDADGVKAETIQFDILETIREHDGEANAKEIAEWLGKKPANITRELAELAGKGVLVKGKRQGRFVPYRLTTIKHDDHDDRI